MRGESSNKVVGTISELHKFKSIKSELAGGLNNAKQNKQMYWDIQEENYRGWKQKMRAAEK